MMHHRQTSVKRPRRRWLRRLVSSTVAVVLIGYLAGTYLAQPAASLSVQPLTNAVPVAVTAPAKLAWPSYGQAALGTTDQGLLASHGQIESTPIASIGKLMTALAVMKKHPLQPGQQGPTITITQADQDIYDWYYVRDGSLAAIKVGEKITEYQALQALLLPSANNFAYTLARWAFGSKANYVAFANQYAQELGLTDSHFVDASGFNPQTKSSATDLIKLTRLVLQDPVLASIVQQKSAKIPVAGKIYNTNDLLWHDSSVIGIKTGTTQQAGKCLVFAANYQVGGQTITLVGVILGAPSHQQLYQDAARLLASAKRNLQTKTVVEQGQVVGHYDVPWGGTASVSAATALKAVVWPGRPADVKLNLEPLQLPAQRGDIVGHISTTALALPANDAVEVKLDKSLTPPSWWWRLTHPADTWQLAF